MAQPRMVTTSDPQKLVESLGHLHHATQIFTMLQESRPVAVALKHLTGYQLQPEKEPSLKSSQSQHPEMNITNYSKLFQTSAERSAKSIQTRLSVQIQQDVPHCTETTASGQPSTTRPAVTLEVKLVTNQTLSSNLELSG